ncbi:MAG TPA: DUF1992 domain-containing protein [Desulfosporosinus sp.]|nr:DUF1992 domain-containing protein [Desulfosporosinus sp.]
MDFGKLVEQKVGEAIARGEAKNLPGAGKPVKIENFYFLPPEFKFVYTVLKNSGYLNLGDDEKVPVSSTSDDINPPNMNVSNPIKSIEEKTASSDEVMLSNVNPSKPTEHVQQKALNYNIIRDSRRRKF